MANAFKPCPFDNIIKKYTLCSICDGKIIGSPFLLCGCSVILCTYCNEKHICKFHYQAIKFDSFKDNKSLNFIDQLSALMTTIPSKGDNKNKAAFENSYSASLPDLDNLMVDETTNGEISFSQLFDDKSLRNETPKASISSIKRESISPRISYTLKRKQYLSDSEDEEIFNKNESILYKRLSVSSSSRKKKITKKMKCSYKSRDIFSTTGCDSDSAGSERQTLQRKKINRKGRHSVPAGMPFGVSTSPINEASLPVREAMLTVEEIAVPLEDKSLAYNRYDAETNPNNIQEFVKETGVNNVDSPVQKIMTSDRPFENHGMEQKIEGLQTCSPLKRDDSEIISSNVENNIKCTNQILNQSDEKPNNLKKQRNSSKRKESKSQKNKISKSDKQSKNKDHHTLNDNHNYFDGFDQCEINASTLNYMLYKLTTPCKDNDEMMFPMQYKGKTFIIHLNDKFDGEFSDNEHHYILKPFKTSQNHFVQTEAQTRSKSVVNTQTEGYNTVEVSVGRDDETTGSTQTDSYEVFDACVGRGGEKARLIQTDSYQVVDACVGRGGEKARLIQTDSYQVVDACVGPEGKISEVSQTEKYQVQDSSTNTKDSRCCAIQTDLFNNSSSDLWSKNHAVSGVQTDLYSNKMSDVRDLHCASNMMRNNTTEIIQNKVIPDAEVISDEDEDIIEGTPVKMNVSLASLDLSSALKGRSPQFDLSETLKGDEIISCSDLGNIEKLCVQKFTQYFGMEYSEHFNVKTTHLVVSSRLTNDSHKTFKYLLGIASKAYIVSFDWVKDSIERKKVLPVRKYIPTNHAGPMRCRMNVSLPFSGLTLCVQLLTDYPGVKAMEALCKLCGAYIVEDIEQYNSPQKWPFPRFCLFEEESQLTSQILNSCSKNHMVAVDYEWLFDSVAAYARQPLLKYLCSTFILTDDIIEKYKIPSDMLVDANAT